MDLYATRFRREVIIDHLEQANIPDQLYELTSVDVSTVSRAHASRSSKIASYLLILESNRNLGTVDKNDYLEQVKEEGKEKKSKKITRLTRRKRRRWPLQQARSLKPPLPRLQVFNGRVKKINHINTRMVTSSEHL